MSGFLGRPSDLVQGLYTYLGLIADDGRCLYCVGHFSLFKRRSTFDRPVLGLADRRVVKKDRLKG